jgi:hypothetical protein
LDGESIGQQGQGEQDGQRVLGNSVRAKGGGDDDMERNMSETWTRPWNTTETGLDDKSTEDDDMGQGVEVAGLRNSEGDGTDAVDVLASQERVA